MKRDTDRIKDRIIDGRMMMGNFFIVLPYIILSSGFRLLRPSLTHFLQTFDVCLTTAGL